MRIVMISLFAAGVVFLGCQDTEQLENLQREKTSLEAKVKRLENKVETLEARAVQAPVEQEPAEDDAPADDPLCKKQLDDCAKRLEACEKDPFTGTKYLAGGDKGDKEPKAER